MILAALVPVCLRARPAPPVPPPHAFPPAALSEKVKDKPVGVDILGARITLFR